MSNMNILIPNQDINCEAEELESGMIISACDSPITRSEDETSATVGSAPATELAYTGSEVVPLASLAVVLSGVGVFLKRTADHRVQKIRSRTQLGHLSYLDKFSQ